MRGTAPAAALIDVGGTLWPDAGPAPEDLRELQITRLLEVARQLDRERSEAVVDCLRQSAQDHEQALVQNTAAVIDHCLHATGASALVDPAGVRRALCLPATPEDLYPDAGRLLGTVKKLGLRCIVFSNAMWRDGDAYLRDFRSLGVLDLVDAVVSSVDIGYRKPHAKMFEAALALAGCAPSACVVIGDSEVKDIRPAVRLQMLAMLVAIDSDPPATTEAHAVVTSLAEACRVLRSWLEKGDR